MHQNILIKICGIKDAATLDFVISHGADLVGFVHFAKSPRNTSLPEIADLMAKAKGQIKTVVLLVNPEIKLFEQASAMRPDFIQLHGNESPQLVGEFITKFEQPVLKALPVAKASDLNIIPAYIEAGADILLDAKPPKEATRPGGLGQVFDWNLLDGLDPDIDFMLSGGLHPDNIAKAISVVRPFGIDVSSGVESTPGQKDHGMIKNFITNAKNALI